MASTGRVADGAGVHTTTYWCKPPTGRRDVLHNRGQQFVQPVFSINSPPEARCTRCGGKLRMCFFSEIEIEEFRPLLTSCIGAPQAEAGLSPGQFFRLGLLQSLAQVTNYPDQTLPEELEYGFVTGCFDPIHLFGSRC